MSSLPTIPSPPLRTSPRSRSGTLPARPTSPRAPASAPLPPLTQPIGTSARVWSATTSSSRRTASTRTPPRSSAASSAPATRRTSSAGCVRDLLLGGKPKDFDVATSARPGGLPVALPQLPHHRPPLPPRPHPLRRGQGHRGRDLPAKPCDGGPGRGDERGHRRPAHPERQRLRRGPRRRDPPRLHDERALLRHRPPPGPRLVRRHAGRQAPRHPHDRRPHGPLPGRPHPPLAGHQVRGPARPRHRPRRLRRHGRHARRPLQGRPPAPLRGALAPAPRRRRPPLDVAALGDRRHVRRPAGARRVPRRRRGHAGGRRIDSFCRWTPSTR